MINDGEQQWDGWTSIVEPKPHLHANVAAKVPKLRPDLYTDADYTIWVDAGCTFTDQLVNEVTKNKAEWTMFTHPVRIKLRPEVEVSRLNKKYDPLDLEGQVDHYLSLGYPNDQLWGTGLIGRTTSDHNARVGDVWLREICRWGFQDQLSFPYVCWTNDLQPVSLGKRTQLSVDWVKFADHTQKEFEEGYG